MRYPDYLGKLLNRAGLSGNGSRQAYIISTKNRMCIIAESEKGCILIRGHLVFTIICRNRTAMFHFIDQLQNFMQESAFYLKPWTITIAIIWCVDIVNWVFGSRLNILGIYPRRLFGLVGILFAPFLHRNFGHLAFNTVPLFVLGLAILAMSGTLNFIWVTIFIMVVSGLAVWLFARKGIHIGASGVISGYFGYILMLAYKQPGFMTILLAILAIYYFGGILIGLFPQEKQTSWESHLFGFLSGMFCAYFPNGFFYFRHLIT